MHPKRPLDPRYFQIIFQAIFLSYGIMYLGWNADWLHYGISVGGCLIFNYIFESLKQKRFLSISGRWGMRFWGFSVLISALSLCLLLKTNHWQISLLAAFLTVISKYIFQIRQKHIFNPSAFGIIAAMVLTQDAWLSPGQWGSNAVMFFSIITMGTIVVTRVQKLDISLAFLIAFVALLFWRQVYVLGWPMDHLMHSVTTGSLLLFTFFMISDPKTSPNHPVARVLWGILIAVLSFYLATFRWKYNTPLWVLVGAAPLVPILDKIFKAKSFGWTAQPGYTASMRNVPSTETAFSFLSKLKKIMMKPFMKKFAASLILAAMISHEAAAFCGFYVSKADGTLKNKTSQVILVRDGDRNVITMYNDFKGNFKDFAMVVPVPVVLKESDIKVVNQQIFSTLNEYSKPRLVEYYDENPCNSAQYDSERMSKSSRGAVPGLAMRSKSSARDEVKIEAQYVVGEYDILILSAKESSALKTWLGENGYKIPAGAEEVLGPYIKSNLKFFVVKVNEEEKKKLPGNFLRPIQITFTSPKFMLPIRLGMANADGDQDMIVYAFTKTGRVECSNYRTVSIPTGKNIPLFVQNNFGNFYANVFNRQWTKEGKALTMLEYAWDVSPRNNVKCDPCVAVAPSSQDLAQAGVWWITRNWNDYRDANNYETASNNVYFTRLHIRYNRAAFPQDLLFQSTPNTEPFQARYIITHPATGNLDCEAGKIYLRQLRERRQDEMEMLTYLTGKSYDDWDLVMNTAEDKYIPIGLSYKTIAESNGKDPENKGILFAAIGALGFVSFIGFKVRTEGR